MKWRLLTNLLFAWMLRYKGLAVLLFILICSLFVGNENPIVSGLMISFVSGAVFWCLACLLPEIARKRVLKRTLRWQYAEFKRVVIDVLCAACQEKVTEQEKQSLFECKKFREWFAANNTHGDRMDMAMSGLDSDDELLKDLLYEFHCLSKIVGEMKLALECSNETQLKTLCFLEKRLYDFENKTCYKCDPTKYIGEFLFEVFGGFSQIKGDTDVDWIQECIDNI